ncbi:MAG: hypothetical protein P1V20_30015 [Verrucomicrobiales bacterium]|nr:hypothetical protein [Verrucomicrobiales bacterium]
METNFVGAYDKRLIDMLLFHVAASYNEGAEIGTPPSGENATFENTTIFNPNDPDITNTVLSKKSTQEAGTNFFADPGNNKNHLHFFDQLHDYEAARNETLIIRRKRMLDDSHDRWGGVLHHLSFDISFIPPKGVERIARLEAEIIEIEEDCPDQEGFQKRFISGLRSCIADEVLHLQDRVFVEDFHPTLYGEITKSVLFAYAKEAKPESPSGPDPAESTPGFEIAANPGRFPASSTGFSNLHAPPQTRIQEILTELKNSKNEEKKAALVEELAKLLDALEKQKKAIQAQIEACEERVGAAEKQARYASKTADRIRSENSRLYKTIAELKERLAALEVIPNDPLELLKSYMDQRYSQFNQWIEVRNQRGLREYDALFATPKIPTGDFKSEWASLMSKNPKLRGQVSVIAVEPSEHAQNVSGVAAFEQIRSLAGMFTGGFGGGFGVRAEVQHYMRSQTMIEAITRAPLAIGYVDAVPDIPEIRYGVEGKGTLDSGILKSAICCNEKFGWYLGPRFKIDDVRRGLLGQRREFKIGWDHIEAKHHLAVTMVAPALATSMKIRFTLKWMDPVTGKVDHELPFICKDQNIDLNPDFRSFINGILQGQEGAPKGPLLSTLSNADITFPLRTETTKVGDEVTETVVLNGPTTLFVQGLDLWRSPQVFLDNVEASEVAIASDMKGLTAKFTYLPNPYDGFSDLIVVTSEGRDALLNGVRISKQSEFENTTPIDGRRKKGSRSVSPAISGQDFIPSALSANDKKLKLKLTGTNFEKGMAVTIDRETLAESVVNIASKTEILISFDSLPSSGAKVVKVGNGEGKVIEFPKHPSKEESPLISSIIDGNKEIYPYNDFNICVLGHGFLDKSKESIIKSVSLGSYAGKVTSVSPNSATFSFDKADSKKKFHPEEKLIIGTTLGIVYYEKLEVTGDEKILPTIKIRNTPPEPSKPGEKGSGKDKSSSSPSSPPPPNENGIKVQINNKDETGVVGRDKRDVWRFPFFGSRNQESVVRSEAAQVERIETSSSLSGIPVN